MDIEERLDTAIAMLTAAPQPPEGARVVDDTIILDWLCQQYVEVRTPARYGSHENFIASPEDGDGEIIPSDLREQARKSMLIAPTLAGKEGA